MPPAKHNCFLPVARADARVLILGSLPGAMSLERQQYYAHPRNAFWWIMGRLLNFSPKECDYSHRTEILMKHRLAVWDVCAAAHREGSLDTAIKNVVANDFAEFYSRHPHVELVCFNGAKAEAVYQKNVLPIEGRRMVFQRLPSTSPAHAGMTFEKKFEAWARVLAQFVG